MKTTTATLDNRKAKEISPVMESKVLMNEENAKNEESQKIMKEKTPSSYKCDFNQFNYIDEIEEGKEDLQDDDEHNLRMLIQNVDNNCDLNSIILILNRYMTKHCKKTLDKENLLSNLSLEDLDKFEESNKMMPNFQVSINFSLLK